MSNRKCGKSVRSESLISPLPSWEMLNRNMLVNIKIKSKNSELFCFHLLFYSFRCWLTCVHQGGECVTKLLRHCGGKTRHVIWQLNFIQESRNCVVVRSRGADQVCRLSVHHRNFTRIDVDVSFKCRTEYRILKYEHVKKYTFHGVKN